MQIEEFYEDTTNKESTEPIVQEQEAACQEQVKQLQSTIAYMSAEFDNIRKRMDKEKAQWRELNQRAVLIELWLLLDDFERALENICKSPELAARFSGFELIYKNLSKICERYGISELDTLTHFNPEYHEALLQVPDTGKEPGTIIDTDKKGISIIVPLFGLHESVSA